MYAKYHNFVDLVHKSTNILIYLFIVLIWFSWFHLFLLFCWDLFHQNLYIMWKVFFLDIFAVPNLNFAKKEFQFIIKLYIEILNNILYTNTGYNVHHVTLKINVYSLWPEFVESVTRTVWRKGVGKWINVRCYREFVLTEFAINCRYVNKDKYSNL